MALAAPAGRAIAAVRPKAGVRPRQRRVVCRAEAGDVEAGTGTLLAAAAVVTLGFTALIPLVLQSGDDAAQQMFERERDLDRRKTLDPRNKRGGGRKRRR